MHFGHPDQQQYWPFSDVSGKPKTNLFVLQWFVNYNFGKDWALASAPLNPFQETSFVNQATTSTKNHQLKGAVL